MSKTKKFIIVCAILTGIGFFLTGAGAALGGRITGIGLSRNGFQVQTPQYPYGLDYEAPAYTEKSENLDAFDTVRLSAQYADVSVEVSDHFGIYYRTADSRVPSFSVKDGVLTVEQKLKRSDYSSGWYLFNFNINYSSGSLDPERITVYVPEGTNLTELTLETVDYGDTWVEGIKASSVILRNNYGQMSLENLETGSLTVSMESGDLSVKNTVSDSLNVKQNYGSFVAEQLTVNKDAQFVTESGSLEMKKASFGTLDVDSNYGDFYGRLVQTDAAVFSLESGSCEIREFTANTISVDAEYGDVEFLLTAPLSDYGMDLFTEYGGVDLDGDYMEKGVYTSSKAGRKQIKISCESGEIRLDGSR